MPAPETQALEPAPAARTYSGEIRRLGLERNVAELEAWGYTIVPPEKVAPPAFIDRLRATLIRVATEDRGVAPDLETGSTHCNNFYTADQNVQYLLTRDRVFEEALLNETSLALITYLLGEGCIVHTLSGLLKGPSDDRLMIHSDNFMMPAPFPGYAQVANAHILLSDYDEGAGATCFWPGSHRFCRQPGAAEAEAGNDLPAITAPKGSLVVWHGNTWHGAAQRTALGLRLSLVMFFARPYLITQEWLRDAITPEQLARNPARFATLTQQRTAYPMSRAGTDYDKMMEFMADADA